MHYYTSQIEGKNQRMVEKYTKQGIHAAHDPATYTQIKPEVSNPNLTTLHIPNP